GGREGGPSARQQVWKPALRKQRITSVNKRGFLCVSATLREFFMVRFIVHRLHRLPQIFINDNL
ncbi:MAG: hypothetical protein LBI02_03210, partial [Opitutaceae bacterium]|nr:hypothetical protein [Opitutaceae bacterium]